MSDDSRIIASECLNFMSAERQYCQTIIYMDDSPHISQYGALITWRANLDRLAPDRTVRFALATSYDSFGITYCCFTVKTGNLSPRTHNTTLLPDYRLLQLGNRSELQLQLELSL